MGLKNYYLFLDAFRYAGETVDITDRKYFKIDSYGENEGDDWFKIVEICITEEEEVEIIEIINSFNHLEISAKSDYLDSFFSKNISDRLSFIEITIKDFINLVENYAESYKKFFEVYDRGEPLVSTPNIIHHNIYVNYLKLHCRVRLISWVSFIKALINNIELTCAFDKRLDKLRYTILRIESKLSTLRQEQEQKQELPQKTLKHFFRCNEQYKVIMEHKLAKKLFDDNGFPHKNTPKHELASFLNFLNEYKFLKKQYLKTKELPVIAKILYDIEYNYFIKKECREIDTFKSIRDSFE